MSGHVHLTEICSSCADPVSVFLCNNTIQVSVLPVAPIPAAFVGDVFSFAPFSPVTILPFAPFANLREMTVFNFTRAMIRFNFVLGDQVIPPGGTHNFGIDPIHTPMPAGVISVVTLQGDSGPAVAGVDPAVVVNYRYY